MKGCVNMGKTYAQAVRDSEPKQIELEIKLLQSLKTDYEHRVESLHKNLRQVNYRLKLCLEELESRKTLERVS